MLNLIIILVLITLQPLNLSNSTLLSIISKIELSGYQGGSGFFIYNNMVKDLTGKRFGKLVVLKRVKNKDRFYDYIFNFRKRKELYA